MSTSNTALRTGGPDAFAAVDAGVGACASVAVLILPPFLDVAGSIGRSSSSVVEKAVTWRALTWALIRRMARRHSCCRLMHPGVASQESLRPRQKECGDWRVPSRGTAVVVRESRHNYRK